MKRLTMKWVLSVMLVMILTLLPGITMTAYAADVVSYVYYTQEKREQGKSKFNLRKYYDFAIGGIVNLSKCLPRRIICFSLGTNCVSFTPAECNILFEAIVLSVLLYLSER